MIREFSGKFVNCIAKDKCSSEEIEQMKYVLTISIFEIIKTLGIIVIFSLAGYLKECLITTCIMCLTKPYMGGYHEDTQLRCFIATMLFTAGEILLSIQCTLSFLSNVILIGLCIFAVYNRAPVINSKMPLTRTELINKNRKKALINVMFFGVLSIALYSYTPMYDLITWVLVCEVMLMYNKKEYLNT